MSQVAMSGQDTAVINSQVLTGFADEDYLELTYPNDIANVKTGKNGNSIYAFNATGKQCELKIRAIRGSADDKFLNNLLVQQQNNFPGFPLMTGTFTKKIGDGMGNVLNDTYVLGGGVFTKIPKAKSNAAGDIEQSVVEYMIKFSNGPRALG